MIVKSTPDDFIVEEIPSFNVLPHGKFFVYKLKKRNMTTLRAIKLLARQNNLPEKKISFAGLKDKVAVTTQHITSPKPLINNDPSITIEHVGFLDEPLYLGQLRSNKFCILVREVYSVHDFVAINYFGNQRFSKNNVSTGIRILKRDFSAAASSILADHPGFSFLADKYSDPINIIRKVPLRIVLIYLHSVQSAMWNYVVSSFIRDNYCDVRYSDDLVFPRKIDDLEVPLIGAVSDLGIWSDYYTKAEEKFGVKKSDFLIRQIPYLTLEGTTRSLKADIEHKILVKKGNTAHVHLVLGSGCYATVCLRAWLS